MLDFCNSLFHGLPAITTKSLQTKRNDCARFLTGAFKEASSFKQLESLHWLPVVSRRKYKLYLLAFKVAHRFQCPDYFSSLVKHKPSHNFTRQSLGVILVSDFKPSLKTVGDTLFAVE